MYEAFYKRLYAAMVRKGKIEPCPEGMEKETLIAKGWIEPTEGCSGAEEWLLAHFTDAEAAEIIGTEQ